MQEKKIDLQLLRSCIKQMISDGLCAEVDRLTDVEFQTTSLKEDWGLDSLDLIEMTMKIERDLGIVIPDSVLADFAQTPGTVKDFLDRC